MTFSTDAIERLATEVGRRISKKRFSHTVGVARMAELLSAYCLPEKREELICAAYLHDVTKELSLDEHKKLISEYGLPVTDEDMSTDAILHSFSAYCVVKRDFPDLATPDILSGVFNHTIGAPDMSVFDEIIFLSDYIEQTRSYESSVKLREYVLNNMKAENVLQNVDILHRACVIAIDNTVLHLINEKKAINTKNILTRNALLGKILLN